jgi:hypothetical protein
MASPPCSFIAFNSHALKSHAPYSVTKGTRASNSAASRIAKSSGRLDRCPLPLLRRAHVSRMVEKGYVTVAAPWQGFLGPSPAAIV